MSYNPITAKAYRERKKEERKAYHKKYMEQYRQRPYVKKYYSDYYRENEVVIKQRACDISRMKLYGITPKQFEAMVAKQKGLCFICDKPPKGKFSLGVDHSHVTGEIRVLLCANCNWLAGKIEAIGWERIKRYGEIYLAQQEEAVA